MKNIFKSILACLMALMSNTSCSDFLDENLNTIYDLSHFETQQGLDDLVTGAYQTLKLKFNYSWGGLMFNMGVDEFTDAANDAPSFNGYSRDLNSEENTVNSANIEQFWDGLYNGIASVNTVIHNMPLYYDKENANYTIRLAEAHFMRGMFYLQLVVQYGGVSLKLEPSGKVETYFVRNTEEECFAQVLSDLEFAYNNLPTSPGAPGRLTKWAAAHFLAKTHLTRASELYDSWNSSYQTNDLDAVIRYATEVVNAHPLCNDYVQLWDFQEPNGANEQVTEVVLAAQFSNDEATWGRYGNQMHLYYPSQYQNLSGVERDISGGREFSYLRSTNYTMDVFDRVNDSRFWKSFITLYGSNNTSGAPEWTTENIQYAPAGSTVGEKRFVGGEVGIKYIVNNAGDNRYVSVLNDVTGVLKNGVMERPHTFVRYFSGEPQEWVGVHGNYGYYGTQVRSVALSKFRDGYRVNIASQYGTRDGILARSAEDVLMIAEAYIRKGESYYTNAIEWINRLRTRAAYKEGEDRSKHVDGGQAYKNNPYCDGKGGGYSAEGAVYWDWNTYYESNNLDESNPLIFATDEALIIRSVDDIYNSETDKPIYEKLGITSNTEKMMCFLLNERTRKLCGETYRWEDLARTKTLESRWKAFNDGWVRGNSVFDANTHYYRPIPQSFLDGVTDENGNALTAAEKDAMQNPGY